MSMRSVDSSKGKLRNTYIAIMIPLGVAINLVGGQVASKLALPLYMDSIATAFIIGFMAKSGKFTTWVHAVVATILVALANAIMGAPIAVVVYGGIQGGGVDLVVAGFLAAGQDILSAAFLARVPINLVDKGIACFVAWLILMRLPENMRTMAGSRKKAVAKND